MQRVTNCVPHHEDQVLFAAKAKTGLVGSAGRQMESGESVKDSVVREYREETGIYILNPQLKGVFTFIIKEGDQIVQEWMMFTLWQIHLLEKT
ncbi:NUDIX domain-containing protein [Bacillus sp. SL00103]